MATTATRLTVDDLELLPQEREGDRHEIIDGELSVTPSPVPRHQTVVLELAAALRAHVRALGLGRVFVAPIDVRLDDTNVVVPDVVVVRADRLGIVGPTRIEGAPDLLVEILSPSTRGRDLGAKRALYARFGVAEYWVVDPAARSVAVFVRDGEAYRRFPADSAVARSEVVAGFAIPLAELFADA